MDLSQIRAKLADFNSNKKSSYDDTKKNYWKPVLGKQEIRIVPYKFNKDFPFTEMKFHYNIGTKMSPSLSNWGEKDPIEEFSADLKAEYKWGTDEYNLAYKLTPKTRYFVPVLVRGEETLGVRFWEFGKELYLEMLNIISDEDYGDITDIEEGRDITVDTVGPEVTGTKYNKTTIRCKPKTKALSEDPKLVKKWLEEQSDLKTLYTKLSYDTIKGNLAKWLQPSTEETSNGDSETETENTESKKVEVEVEKPVTAEKAKTKSASKKFADLFPDGK